MRNWQLITILALALGSCADQPSSSVKATGTSRSGEAIDTESSNTWALSRNCEEIISKLVDMQGRADMSTVLWEREDVSCVIDLLSKWSNALNLANAEIGQFDGLLPQDEEGNRLGFKKIGRLANAMSQDMLSYDLELYDGESGDPDENIAYYEDESDRLRWHMSAFPLSFDEVTMYCESINGRGHLGSQKWMNVDYTLIEQKFSRLLGVDSVNWSGVDPLRLRSKFSYLQGGQWFYGYRAGSNSDYFSSNTLESNGPMVFAMCVRRLN